MNQQEITRMLESLPGRVGLYIHDLKNDWTLSHRAAMPVVAASVIKLYVMAEAFRQREAGLLDFDRPVTVRDTDKLPSCGALTYLSGNVTLPVRDLVTLMIILSDNTATNLLIPLLGMYNINSTIDALGLTGTRLNRMLFQPALAAQGIENCVTAGDCGLFMEKLLAGEAVSPAASAEMLALLRRQRLNGKMPFFLHSRGIVCAHKTGEDEGITHDVGVIEAEDRPIVFCFVSEKTDVPRAERVLQDLARMAVFGE